MAGRRKRTDESEQLPLFPMGICECEHVFLMMEDGEPCPRCMEGEDSHDCAGRTNRKVRRS